MSTQTMANAPTGLTDPHQHWLDEWKGLRAKHLRAEEGSDEESSLWDEFHELEQKLHSTPAMTQAGACAQIEWILAEAGEGEWIYPDHREALKAALTTLKEGMAD